MSPDDTAELCCAAGICCDAAKRRLALASLLRRKIGTLSEIEADRVADVIHDAFTLLPKAAGMDQVIKYVQDHPYDS